MTDKRILGLLLVLIVVAIFPAPAQDTKEIAVVVNSANPVNSVSMKELKDLYLGDRMFWSSKTPVLLILHTPNTPETGALLRTVVKMSDLEFKKHWDAKVFRGEAPVAPPTVFSNGMAGEAVSSIGGAITILQVKDIHGKGKILKVDGLLPGQPGYPLHE